jgi:hypothetical protein
VTWDGNLCLPSRHDIRHSTNLYQPRTSLISTQKDRRMAESFIAVRSRLRFPARAGFAKCGRAIGQQQ